MFIFVSACMHACVCVLYSPTHGPQCFHWSFVMSTVAFQGIME